MERISVDSLGPLPKSHDFEHIMVIIDNFTRFVELHPCKTLEAEEASTYLNIHCGRFGTPYQILSDGGTQFNNEKVDRMCEILNLEHVLTMPYSKQENAIVERINKEILRHLRAFIFDNRVLESWYECVPMVQRILNSTPHESIGVSPAQLLFGNAVDLDRGLYSPVKLMESTSTSENNLREWYDKMLSHQTTLLKIARDIQQEKDKVHLASNSPENPTSYRIGSYVLARYPNTKMGHVAPTKLHTPWKGPLRVVSSDGARYTVQNLVTLKNEDFHVTDLKEYLYDPQTSSPEQVALSDSQSFIIERVIRHKGNPNKKKTLFFKVKWAHELNETWEPWSNLRTNAIVHNYCKENKLKRLISKAFS
jgi:transposase InsO family protein